MKNLILSLIVLVGFGLQAKAGVVCKIEADDSSDVKVKIFKAFLANEDEESSLAPKKLDKVGVAPSSATKKDFIFITQKLEC